MDLAIRLDKVDKEFRFGESHKTLFSFLKKKVGQHENNKLKFKALNAINFEIKKGEKVGIIGNNGAGKTTLLKTIAGIYKAKSGGVFVDGKMALLSGLGTGMLQDLTVEENLYLYGAIYRLDRDKIRSKIPEILEWAELQDFLFAQLKTLSSGMLSRLAFSVTRHIDADIYLLDEVLSAGDKNFRKKCDQYFEKCKFSKDTFLVSTHNINFVQSFCSKTIWLQDGKVMAFGETSEVVTSYMDEQK